MFDEQLILADRMPMRTDGRIVDKGLSSQK